MSRARDGGGGRGVVMVAQRGGTKREATSKPSAKQRGGDKPVDHDKKRMSVAGGMWDSFESESASEDEEESDDATDGAKDRRSQQRGSTNSDNSNNSNNISGSLSSRQSNRRRGSSSRHHHDSTDRTKHGDQRKYSSSSKRSNGKLASNRGSDRKTTRSTRSFGSDGGSGGSDVRSSSHKRRSFSKGDSVVVYLSSGEQAKGTISRESSTTRGRYDVKLEKGGAQRHVDSRDISPARRRRGHSGTTSERSSVRELSSVRGCGTSSRNSYSSEDRRSSDSRSHSPQRRPSSSDGVKSKYPPPSSDSAEAVGDNNQPSGGPAGPPSSGAVAAATTPTSEGDKRPKEESQVIDAVAAPGRKNDASNRPDAAGSEARDGDDSDDGDDGDDGGGDRGGGGGDTGDSAGKTSGSERSSSPIRRKVRQAQGLLKTMFLKKGEERNGGERTRSNSGTRRWPGMDSLSRRFSTNSSDHRGMESASAASSCDDVDRQNIKSPNTKNINALRASRASTPGDGDGDGDDQSIDDTPRIGGANEATTAKTAGGRARRLSRGLVRGRSRNRKEEMLNKNGASPSPASRSPSIVNRLGVTIRGAVMGSTRLGVHQPHVDQASAAASPAGSGGSDGDATQGTYSTGASMQRRQLRRRRRSAGGLKRDGDATKGRQEEVVTYSSDGFDDDMFSQGSPLAPTTYAGDPRNLPDAVSSYIGAREKIEHETSASGPVFLPRSDNLVQGSGDGMLGRGKRRGSLDITKGAASTTQRSEQNQPFTEAMFKAGVSETRHSTKQGILLEGDLQKFSPESMRGVRWHKRYFVLYASSCELRYYRTHAEAAWGRIPLGERGSIPLRLVVKIEQPSDKKYRGCRFDLVVLHKGDGRHPGLHIRPGHESRVVTTKTFKFNAADAQQRLLWVTVIEALMKKHGWGLDADRRRNMRAPRHGGPSAAASDSLWGAWGGEAEAEVSGEHSRRDAGRSSVRDSRKQGSFEDLSAANTSDLRWNANGRMEAHPSSRKNSVMAFVEAGDYRMHPPNAPQTFRSLPERDEASPWLGSLGRVEPGRQRGIRIPYSPQGRRGSLTTEALSPPVPACGGARRQSSLKSDLRPTEHAEVL